MFIDCFSKIKLTDQEQTQAEKFLNKDLKDRYVISHGFLRHLLSFCKFQQSQNIACFSNQFGKPFLKGNFRL